jgi:hypothetical protein
LSFGFLGAALGDSAGVAFRLNLKTDLNNYENHEDNEK